MTMGIREAINELRNQNLREPISDLFFVSVLGNGKIYAGFEYKSGDLFRNVSLYYEMLRDELAEKKGEGGSVLGAVKKMEKVGADVHTLRLGHDGVEYEIEVRIKSREKQDPIPLPPPPLDEWMDIDKRLN